MINTDTFYCGTIQKIKTDNKNNLYIFQTNEIDKLSSKGKLIKKLVFRKNIDRNKIKEKKLRNF